MSPFFLFKKAFFLDWLELFRRLGPEMAPRTE
jgi:hypothetical protein